MPEKFDPQGVSGADNPAVFKVRDGQAFCIGFYTDEAGAALVEAAEALNVFVVCGDAGESQPLELDVRGFEGWRLKEHVEMFAEDPHAANTWEHPDAILPRRNPDTRLDKGILTAQLHPDSWNVFRLTRKPDQG